MMRRCEATVVYDSTRTPETAGVRGAAAGKRSIGFLADSAVFGEPVAERDGLFAGGGVGLLGEQIFANVFVLIYAFVVTFVIAKVLDRALGLRVVEDDERIGLDQSQHAESAYN